MANSGSASTPYYQNKRITFSWYVDNINADNGTGTVHWSLYVEQTDSLYHLLNGGSACNHFSVNGSEVYSRDNTYYNGKTVYNGYTTNRYLANKEYYDTNGDWTGVVRWVYGIKDLASGSFTIYYSEEGYASFSVGGQFKWYSSAHNSGFINTSFSLDKIDRFNKAYGTGNSGSGWSQNKYFYKTNDYGRTWTKCKGYKTTNSGNNWSKI